MWEVLRQWVCPITDTELHKDRKRKMREGERERAYESCGFSLHILFTTMPMCLLSF